MTYDGRVDATREPQSTPFPLDEALVTLGRVAASGALPKDPALPHVRVSRALDVLAGLGVVAPAERLVPHLASLTDDESLLDLLVTLLADAKGVAAAVRERARQLHRDALATVSIEAAAAYAARRVLVVPAREIGAYLPRSIAISNEFRREELARAWAASLGLPVSSKGKPEKPDRSARALEKLDYRRIRIDEERLAIERTVLAEHAAKVRAKQAAREAEAQASAQRE